MVHKTKKLLIPYLGGLIFYALITTMLRIITPVDYGKVSVPQIWCDVWEHGAPLQIYSPTWYVITYWMIYCAYNIVRKILDIVWNDAVVLILLIVGGFASVYNGTQVYETNTLLIQPFRIAFLIQFYELGICYKKYIEKWFKKIPGLLVLLVTVSINIWCIAQRSNINFLVNVMRFGDVPETLSYTESAIPGITALTGIMTWLVIADWLTPLLKDNKVCIYISKHTFGIMSHHVFAICIFNWVLALLNKIHKIENLDVAAIKTSAWYRYDGFNRNFYFFYFVCGIIGSVCICHFMDYIKFRLNSYKAGRMESN